MYEDFRKISVIHGPSIELIVNNPTNYKMVGKGAHGAVFKLDDSRCVKIYADKANAELEAKSYTAAQDLGLVPRLFESWDNYNILEYIKGPTLYEYLRNENGLNMETTAKLISALDKMKAAGFTRLDAALWHFLMDSKGELKLIDIVYAMVREDPYPVKILSGMKDLGLLNEFLGYVRKIDIGKYLAWKSSLGVFFSQ